MNNDAPIRPQLHAIFAAALQAWLQDSSLAPLDAAIVLGVDQSIVGQLCKNPRYLSTDVLTFMWEHVGDVHITLEVDPKWSRE